MAGDETTRDAERLAARQWFLAEQRRLDAVTDEEWAALRDAEVRHIRQRAADRRRSAA